MVCDVDAGVCPPSAPPEGSYCGDNGLSCPSYFGGYCPPQVVCENNQWTYLYPPCPPPPPCPMTQPGDYTQCFDVGQSCFYSYGCGSAYCQCQNPGSWFCTIGDCVDGGGWADAGVIRGDF
jgi:hypothetical protein